MKNRHIDSPAQTFKRLASRGLVAILSVAAIAFPLQQALASGTLTIASVALSDPRPSAAANSVNYTISWKAATTATIECVQYQFTNSATGLTVPTGFSSTSSTNGTFTNLSGSWTIANATNGLVQETNATGTSVTSGTQVTTVINSLTNPTNSSGETDFVQISDYTNTSCTTPAGGNDAVTTAFATTPGVLISATVNPSLTFAVAGLGNSAAIKSGVSTQAAGDPCATSTATAVSFPTDMVINTDYTCGQSLTTSTNASSGYDVTLRGTHSSGDFLKSVSNPSITITDHTGTNASPSAWPATSIEAFGYTTNAATLSTANGGSASRFGTNNVWAKVDNNTVSNSDVDYATGPTNAQVANIGYRIRFMGSTEASVYTGTVIYTCTPTF